MTIAEQIKRARERLGLSQSELARRIGVSKTAVSKREDGQTAPNRRRAVAVAKALGIPLEDVSSLTSIAFTHIDEKRSQSNVPFMGWETFVNLQGQLDAAVLLSFPKILADIPSQMTGVALRIEDDCMAGVVDRGDTIIVCREEAPKNDDIVVALAGKDVLLRRYAPRGPDSSGAASFDLLSTNPDLPTRTVNSSNPGKVLGVVVEIRKRRRV